MKTSTHDLVQQLLNEPLNTEHYIATFSRTGTNAGLVHFRHRHSSREATIQWQLDEQQGEVLLSYDWFPLLRVPLLEIRERLIKAFPIF